MKIWLDCDGVLADFDRMFIEITGMHPRKYEEAHGPSGMWKIVATHEGGFFRQLPKMPDAVELYEAVKHLNPTILTGVPLGNPQYNQQKLEWAEEHFPGVPMICCQSKLKYTQIVEGKHNIIVDDWHKYKHVWEENGGTFVLHTSAQNSIIELRELGII
jgi:5'(3')-deoxyribonucleotidase